MKKACKEHSWEYFNEGDARRCKNCTIEQMKSGFSLMPHSATKKDKKRASDLMRNRFLKEGFIEQEVSVREVYCRDCYHSSEIIGLLKEGWCGKCRSRHIERERDKNGKMIPIKKRSIFIAPKK